MTKLLVIIYDNEFKAEEVRLALVKSQNQYLQDSVVVVKDKDERVKITQTFELSATSAEGANFWSLLIGSLFLSPMSGTEPWASSSAAIKALSDIGVNQSFLNELRQTIVPGTSALFILVEKAFQSLVVGAAPFLRGRVLQASLAKNNKAELRTAFADYLTSLHLADENFSSLKSQNHPHGSQEVSLKMKESNRINLPRHFS